MASNYIWENPQTINFTTITAKTTASPAFTCTATTTLTPVTFVSNTPTICTVVLATGVVTMVGATGTGSITANQVGDHTYYPGTKTNTFAVT
jgi:hypothetical protein